MPVRSSIRLLRSILRPAAPATPLPSLPLPCIAQQIRPASILAALSDTKGAYNKRIRRGRGPSSGKGKTSGRGHKGQKQHGKVPAGFGGGQTLDSVVSGKHGFKNIHADEMSPVNLDRIQDWINQERIDPQKPITVRELTSTRAIHGVKDGVKLLARGSEKLTSPVNIVVSRASSAAIAAVEARGGTVTTRFYTRYAIRRIRQGKTDPFVSLKWEPEALNNPALAAAADRIGMGSDPVQRVKGMGFQYRLPDPTRRKDIEYYRDPAKRGYLVHTVREGETPSLYYRMPRTKQAGTEKAVDRQKKNAAENRLW